MQVAPEICASDASACAIDARPPRVDARITKKSERVVMAVTLIAIKGARQRVGDVGYRQFAFGTLFVRSLIQNAI
jgi:hypothetical protein